MGRIEKFLRKDSETKRKPSPPFKQFIKCKNNTFY